jgi:hypothetical protein
LVVTVRSKLNPWAYKTTAVSKLWQDMVDSDGDLEIWWIVICAAAPAAYVVDMERENAQLHGRLGPKQGSWTA